MSDVTRILSQIESGDSAAAEQLLPLVYDELRKLAAAKLAHEKPGQTLQSTALVHEAYLRLVGPTGMNQELGVRENVSQEILIPDSCSPSPVSFDSRGHFFAAAAEAMRRILVESARRKRATKHGGGQQRVEIEVAEPEQPLAVLDLMVLDEALSRFERLDAQKAQLVKLRYFAGLSMAEAAAALSISLATAERHWTYARTWLYAALADEDRDSRPARNSSAE